MKRKVLKIIFVIILIFVFLSLLSVGVLAIYTRKSVDLKADEALFSDASAPKSITFYYDFDLGDKEGEYTPVAFYEMNGLTDKREWFSYDDFSPLLREGFIAMEDRRFFSHHGVDIKRTLAALFNLISTQNKSFGGSTITQQVIKNISGDNEKTIKRKVDEIIRAYHIESVHSKKEIFELYLNIIPMGNNITGVGCAAKEYFGKEPSELNCAEAATLIAIANAPTKYNPYRNSELCKEKRNIILSVMREQGIISADEFEDKQSYDVALRKRNATQNQKSAFAEAALNDAIGDLMKASGYSYEAAKIFLYGKNAKIYTTMDSDVQNILENYFKNSDNFPEECKSGLEYSMVICDSRENKLRGIIGGVGERKSPYNQALSLHTPASTLKPLALYLPLINQKKITWSTVFDDVPVSFSENSKGEYVEYPKNSPLGYDGLITVSEALRLSKNTVAVRLYNLLSAEKVYKGLKEDFGFDTLVYKEAVKGGVVTDLSASPLALGQLTRGISLKKLTESYTVFPGEGNLKKGRSYLYIFDSENNLLYENEGDERRIAEKEAARVMTQMLSRVVESGTASKITLKNLYDTAGKTGTSGGSKDKIFVGFTPYYTAGIWCGYPDNNLAVGAGEKNHFTVWDDVMKQIHEKTVNKNENERTFSIDGLIFSSFCKDSGELFSESCEYDARGDRMDFGYFIKGTEPLCECTRHIVLYENVFPFISKISLVRAPERDFPKEITVADEKYAYREKRYRNIA